MTEIRPELSIQVVTFAAEDPGNWNAMVDRAVAADTAGIDRLVVSDHVAFGENLDAYADPTLGGTEGGRQPTGPDGHWLEPLTVLTYLAARTRRIRLGTSILQAALRRPAVLAKAAATLDVLSGGRLDLGVGVGWQEEEYGAAGLDFAGRGRLLDHTLEVCQALWRDERADYSSDELSFSGIHAMPKPLQPGGVPIWVSGTVNARVARRIASFGSGWIPWGPAMADPATGIARMHELLDGLGHDPAGLQVTGSIPVVRSDDGIDLAATMAGAPVLLDAGVTDCRIGVRVPGDRDAATEYLATVVAAFDTATGRTPR
jgi:probable F420-dependent oxidoreductase